MKANEQTHRADEVETVIVDIEVLLELMRRNERDKNEKHSHKFKLSPPFKGEKKLTTVVEEGRYPTEMDPKPVHISPRSILTETTDRGEWNPEWSHPEYGVQRSDFKDAVGKVEKNEEDWEEWWDRAVELWEHEVRSRLEEVNELTLHTRNPDIEDTTMKVRFESKE